MCFAETGDQSSVAVDVKNWCCGSENLSTSNCLVSAYGLRFCLVRRKGRNVWRTSNCYFSFQLHLEGLSGILARIKAVYVWF